MKNVIKTFIESLNDSQIINKEWYGTTTKERIDFNVTDETSILKDSEKWECEKII